MFVCSLAFSLFDNDTLLSGVLTLICIHLVSFIGSLYSYALSLIRVRGCFAFVVFFLAFHARFPPFLKHPVVGFLVSTDQVTWESSDHELTCGETSPNIRRNSDQHTAKFRSTYEHTARLLPTYGETPNNIGSNSGQHLSELRTTSVPTLNQRWSD